MLDQGWEMWCDRAMSNLDSDGSGCIELAEIEKLIMGVSNGQVRLQEARRMLREADLDRDGRISKMVSERGGPAPPQAVNPAVGPKPLPQPPQEFKNLLKLQSCPDALEAYDDRRN